MLNKLLIHANLLSGRPVRKTGCTEPQQSTRFIPGVVSVWHFTCSTILRVLWFSPTFQKHASIQAGVS